MAVSEAQMLEAIEAKPSFVVVEENCGRYAYGYLNTEPIYFGTRGTPEDLSENPAGYENVMNAVMAWCEEFGMKIVPRDPKRPKFGPTGIYREILNSRVVFGSFMFGDQTALRTREALVRRPPFACEVCGDTHSGETLICPETGEVSYCTSCGEWGAHTQATLGIDGVTLSVFCTRCRATCGGADCTNLVTFTDDAYCTSCAAHENCNNCGHRIEWTETGWQPERCNPRGGEPMSAVLQQYVRRYGALPPGSEDVAVEQIYSRVCEDCEEYICPECNWVRGELQYSIHHEGLACERCISAVQLTFTEDDPDEEGEEEDLTSLLSIPGRESVRTCGIEIEGGNGTLNAPYLISRLRAAHLTTAREMQGYHGEQLGFMTVERDSSVDWEAVTEPFNPASDEDMEKLNESVKIIRGMVRKGELKFDLRCGLHIHVSADKVGLPQAYNLSHLFTYIEDPLYRIAAAKWPIHRACQGNGACKPTPKYTRKTEFFQYQGGEGGSHDDHYFSLSFQNYFKAMLNSCRCGARENGFWDECTCSLRKCTFEFRLFNTTANPRKMLAYLALCQALVAKAISLPEIKSPVATYPGLPFNRSPLKGMSDEERGELTTAWLPRLEFIMNDLPLTDEERAAVQYCMLSSEIAVGLGDEVIKNLTKQEVTV